MGSMRERPPGSRRWQLRVHVGDKQYVTETFEGSERDARKALARLEVAAEERRAPRPSSDTVGRLLEDWWSMKSWESVGGRREARDALDRYLLPHLGEIRAAKLTDRHIAGLYAGLRSGKLARRGQPLKESTIRRLHNDLHSALNWAVRKGRLGHNPATLVDKPIPAASGVRGPDTEELSRLLETANTMAFDFAVFVRVAVATGRRREDILGLTAADLRAEDSSLVFNKRAVLGGPGAGVVIEPLDKNYRTARVDIDDRTMGDLVELVAERRAVASRIGGTWGKKSYIFSDDPVGKLPWRPDSASREFRRLRDAAGLPDVTLHGLRHAHITELLENGIDVEAVAKRVGDDPATIYKVYAHSRRISDRRAAAVMDHVLNGAERRLTVLSSG